MAIQDQPIAVEAVHERLTAARQDQVIVLMELLRTQFSCQQLAELCANLRLDPRLRRQVHPVPDIPSRDQLEQLFARLRHAVACIDECTRLLRQAGIEP